MTRFLLVCLGGAAGTGARYLLSGLVQTRIAPSLPFAVAFPWGTLAVNTLGSFAIGVIMAASLSLDWISPTTRLVLTTGFLGGFTTYSTFNYETLQSFEQGAWALGIGNLAATVILCLLAGVAGVAAGRVLFGPVLSI